MQERRPVPALSPSRRLSLGAATAVAVVVLDQLTKSWALRALDDGPRHLVWTLRLKLTFNSGAAFGLGQGLAPLLIVVGVGLVVVLLGVGRSAGTTLPAIVSVGLVLGGAVGNLADRLVRDHGGAVVDFVDLQWWPVFNVADAAITCGAVLLVLTASLSDRSGADEAAAGHDRAGA
ncbi:MAG TPA: signal peptidase II [Acidimicrobiales bacterium]|nr:signal peptidase II [Acidimicrobiales bacterium]